MELQGLTPALDQCTLTTSTQRPTVKVWMSGVPGRTFWPTSRRCGRTTRRATPRWCSCTSSSSSPRSPTGCTHSPSCTSRRYGLRDWSPALVSAWERASLPVTPPAAAISAQSVHLLLSETICHLLYYLIYQPRLLSDTVASFHGHLLVGDAMRVNLCRITSSYVCGTLRLCRITSSFICKIEVLPSIENLQEMCPF